MFFAHGRNESCFQATSFLSMNYSIKSIHFIIPICNYSKCKSSFYRDSPLSVNRYNELSRLHFRYYISIYKTFYSVVSTVTRYFYAMEEVWNFT